MATTQQVYSLSDLFESINDIHFQFDEGKMDQNQAYTLARSCCSEFINHTTNKKEPLFLCNWNDSEIIEVHSRESLFAKYEHTNLFRKDEEAQDLEGNTLAVSVLEWIDAITHVNYEWQEHKEFVYDNFKIGRIA